MKTTREFCSSTKGFTLIELAIVLVIIGLLLAMIIPSLGAQRDIRNRNETQRLLNQAKEALIGYVLVNGYLPCPDISDPPNGEDNRLGAVCPAPAEGVLPWKTLGIEGTDAWDHYFGYRPDPLFSNSVALFTIADAGSTGAIQILDATGGNSLMTPVGRPVAIIFSHGANGRGATNTRQVASPNNKQPLVPATALDELANTDVNVIFVTHPPTLVNTVNEFDDMLVWLPPNILVNRMVTAGRLP